MLFLFAAAFVFTVFMVSRSYASAKSDDFSLSLSETECYYTSVTLSAGDSLWSITDKYDELGFESQEAYIDEIKRINNLSGNRIRAGESIIVPYYAESYTTMASVR